jgi:hypothetical protein
MKTKSLLKYPYKFAAIGGIFWGLTLFLLTLLSLATGYGQAFLSLVAGIYPNYSISFSGSFVGLLFGFMDGFIICFLIAFFSGGKKDWNAKKDKPK